MSRVLPRGRHSSQRVTYMQRRLGVSLVAGVALLVVAVLTGCDPADTSQTPTTKASTSTVAGAQPVVKFVDGDTLKVPGATVRFIGIDTPERGQPCYREATQRLQQLVAGRPVTLTAVKGRDDHDRYGRILRYVTVDGQDLGLALIKDGYARARYDSLDKGYQSHPRQVQYRKADAATPQRRCGS